MALRIQYFIDSTKVEVTTERRSDGKGVICRIGDANVCIQAGQPVLSITDRWLEPPDHLVAHITRVAIDSIMVIDGLRRQSGLYRLGNAQGTVRCLDAHDPSNVRSVVEVSCPNTAMRHSLSGMRYWLGAYSRRRLRSAASSSGAGILC